MPTHMEATEPCQAVPSLKSKDGALLRTIVRFPTFLLEALLATLSLSTRHHTQKCMCLMQTVNPKILVFLIGLHVFTNHAPSALAKGKATQKWTCILTLNLYKRLHSDVKVGHHDGKRGKPWFSRLGWHGDHILVWGHLRRFAYEFGNSHDHFHVVRPC